jgi:hypothetical protein
MLRETYSSLHVLLETIRKQNPHLQTIWLTWDEEEGTKGQWNVNQALLNEKPASNACGICAH